MYLMVCIPFDGDDVNEFDRAAIADNIKVALKRANLLEHTAESGLASRMGNVSVTISPYDTITLYSANGYRQVKVIFRPTEEGFYAFRVIINNDDYGERITKIPNNRKYETVYSRADHVLKQMESPSVNHYTQELDRLATQLLA